MRAKASLPLLLVLLLGCSGNSAANECTGLTVEHCAQPDAGSPDAGVEPDASLVVDVDWLISHLDDPDVLAVDTRGADFNTSRIPGAIQLRPGDLSTTVDGVPSQLMPPMDAEPVLRSKGLLNGTIAVVYGAAPEYDPARIVWALQYYGHGDVRYLDGGYAAWVAADGVLDEDAPSVAPSEYEIGTVDESLVVAGDWVLSQLGDAPYRMPSIQLVDARSSSEYESGRIPSAASVDWTRNLDNGFLRSRGELEALYDGFDPTVTTVTYCASGRRGSFAWLTLTALGYEDVRLYDGSWNEWGSGAFPVESD